MARLCRILVWMGLMAGFCPQLRAAEPDAAGAEFFEKNIRPILADNCYKCHSEKEKKGGLVLETREGLLKGGDSGMVIVPGKPEKSILVGAVAYKNPDLQMPPKKRLSADQVAALEKWVAMGAPDPRIVTAAAGNAGPTGMSIEEGRAFWSFKPVANPPIPRLENRKSKIENPIDAFILAKLEASGLQPAPPADRRTLIRRVTFDLTGLPPTPEEVEAFVRDGAPDAYAKLVDRLLASPQYGVRWGRHWLDVARYADSNGLDENLAFGNAWRYRDYVVNAFNSDKPFDRFLIEQIAGDLLPNATAESKTATGFLVLGAKVLAEPDREKLEMDTIDEQIDAMGKAFLGMTFGCARCHDHKFDPIKQTDYYALAAIFKSTRTFGDSMTGVIKHWYEHPLAADAAELAKLKEIDAAITKKKDAATAFRSQAMAKIQADARAKATMYLAAAARFDLSMPLTQIEQIAKPLGLHPRILHHCRQHIEFHRDDPFLARWRELAAGHDVAGIESFYRALFAEADAAMAEAKKKDPKATTLTDKRLEAARLAINDTSGFLAVPPKPEFAFDEKTLAEYNRLAEEARIIESNAPDVPAAMGVSDRTVATSIPIHIRGSHRNLGEPVARGFPQVMRPISRTPTTLPAKQSGRLELAQWMASPQNPLTARVYVNRIWRWHFGEGIVGSTENFGRLGDKPSHPELLDWLARHFVESGWSTKDLHRLILLSSTYQQSSNAESEIENRKSKIENVQVDPENRLLWKFRSRRLEAEEIRDSILFVSGRLDVSLGGKSVPLRNHQFVFDHTSIDHTKYDSLRRAIYLPVIRNNVYTLFGQFDFPDPTMPTGSRGSTVVAPQALLMMNADLVMDSADEFARRLLEHTGDESSRIRVAYERALARPPTEAESKRAAAFLRDVSAGRAVAGAADVKGISEQRAWSLFCHSLLASNEFMYLR